MIKLNLTANNEAEKRIKEYLENNVSETLADKINNGVTITKDNKELINKKDLSGFMNYANEEARKLAEKGARYACVEDATVFGWAIHYFEEDSINGKLFNQDGSEYKAPAPKITKKETPKPQVKVVEKEENKQATLFDFFDNPTETKQEEKEIVEETIEETVEETQNLKEEIEDLIDGAGEYFEESIEQSIKEMPPEEEQIIDYETGEILTEKQEVNTFDKELVKFLYTMLDGQVEVK